MLQSGTLVVNSPATVSLLCAEEDSTKLPLMTSVRKRVSSRLGPTHLRRINTKFTLKRETIKDSSVHLQLLSKAPLLSSTVTATLLQRHAFLETAYWKLMFDKGTPYTFAMAQDQLCQASTGKHKWGPQNKSTHMTGAQAPQGLIQAESMLQSPSKCCAMSGVKWPADSRAPIKLLGQPELPPWHSLPRLLLPASLL